MSKYNGWTNYETWNVALWLGNDESLYRICRKHKFYEHVRDIIMGFESSTPDGIRYDDDRLDINALSEMIRECE